MRNRTEPDRPSAQDDATDDHVLPRSRPGLTTPLPGLGHLERRFDVPDHSHSHRPIIPWKEAGFDGGPDIFVQDSEGGKRLANADDYHGKPTAASESGESDGASSIISVHDFGFSAAPNPFLNRFRECDFPEHTMSAVELRRHLHLEPESGANVEESIREKIDESLAWSQMDNKEYLPINALDAIFSIESIKSLMKEKFSEATEAEIRYKVTQIVGNGTGMGRRRILGILLFMKCFDYIHRFSQEDIWDSDLPLKHTKTKMREFSLRTSMASGTNKTLMQGWERNDVDLFYLYQRMFFVPFFDIQEDKLSSYVLDRDVMLPWSEYQHKTSGGNGMVHQLQIHPSQHNFKGSQAPDKPLYFALKEIDSLDRNTYHQELRALEKCCAQLQKEKHLINLLLTFQHGEKYYLLFEWADGNLEEFWEKTVVTPTNPSVMRWAAEQCLGIAIAVKRIHGLTTWQKNRRSQSLDPVGDDEQEWGRHGDIKPNNILWFSKYGKDRDLLVLSDLGLTRYHSRLTKSLVPQSHIEGYTWVYRPPEMDTGHHISQKYDIWSLGCVYLEFCIWYLEGIDAVRKFETERTEQDRSEIRNMKVDKYFNVTTDSNGHKVAEVKPVVGEWIARLSALDSSEPFARQMLNLIKTRMLVVEGEKRWSIDLICTEISRIRSLTEPPKTTDLSEQTVHANNNEIQSKEKLATLGVNGLVQHARGNSDSSFVDTSAEMGHTPTLPVQATNIEPADNTSDKRSAAGVTPVDVRLDPQPELQVDSKVTPESRNRTTALVSEDEQRVPKFQSSSTQTTFKSHDDSLLLTSSSMTTTVMTESANISTEVLEVTAAVEREVNEVNSAKPGNLEGKDHDPGEHQGEIGTSPLSQHAAPGHSAELGTVLEVTSQAEPLSIPPKEAQRPSTPKGLIEPTTFYLSSQSAVLATDEESTSRKMRQRLRRSWAVVMRVRRRA